MDTLMTYRAVWGEYPWLAAYAALVVVVFVLAVVGTLSGGGILAILFIPSLGGAYAHHLMVMKRAG